MSESFKEHRPLLCDDYSDEEFRFGTSSPKFRRFRHSAPFGRARTHAIGAATIINRWPDHFTSLLAYWWIGLVMIALLIFIVYNSILVITALPSVHPAPLKLKTFEHNFINTTNEKSKTDIFMHIFATNYEELNIDYYLQHIDALSNKYSTFKYNIIVILEDSFNKSMHALSDELNNEIALNSLWIESKKEDKIKLNKNTDVEIVSLSKYMDKSPLKRHWRRLPRHFFGFLSRCIAIWDKGGIAFDPLIITGKSLNYAYLEKIEQILSNFGSSSKKLIENINKIPKKIVNNIQDIIENLESPDKNILDNNLSEAETKNNLIEINSNEVNRNVNLSLIENYRNNGVNDAKNNKTSKFLDFGYKKNMSELSKGREYENLSTYKMDQLNNELTTERDLLPMFLEYLFHRPKNTSEHLNNQDNVIENVTLSKQIKNNTSKSDYDKNNISNMTSLQKKDLHKRISRTKKLPTERKNDINLTIDTKGYLIATETPCHAFIGTVFSNVLHHSYEESITDLIIAELSIFCKGVLSLCKGVDVMLF